MFIPDVCGGVCYAVGNVVVVFVEGGGIVVMNAVVPNGEVKDDGGIGAFDPVPARADSWLGPAWQGGARMISLSVLSLPIDWRSSSNFIF